MKISPVTTHESVVELVKLGARMHAESTFSNMDYDRQVVAETTLRLVDNPDGLVLQARIDDRMIGGIMAMVTPSFFGKDRVASELGLFVEPERRGCRAAVELIQYYVAWAKTRDVKRINGGNSAGMNDERYVKLMKRLGFVRAGSLMYMEN